MPFGAHPEFGYFCPAPRLRRKLRLSIAVGILGLIAAGSATGIFSRNQEVPARDAYALAPPEELALSSGTITTVRGAFGSPLAESGVIPPMRQVAPVEQGKSACQDRQENTWKYLDGQCGVDKPRKMRNVHVMTERPPIAAVAIGHSRSSPRAAPVPEAPAAALVGVPAIIAARPSVTVAASEPAVTPARAVVPPPATSAPAVVAAAPNAEPAAAPAAPAPAVKKPVKPAQPAPTRVVRRDHDEPSVRRSEVASVRRSEVASARRSEESSARHSYTSPYAAPIYHYGSARQYTPGWSLF